MERILEPLTALSTFYTVISNIPVDTESDPEYLYNKSNMERLHWLNEDERYVLFSLVYLLTNYDLTGEDILLDYTQSDPFIWRDLINPQDLNDIFNHGQIGLSQEKLWKIARLMGFSLVKETFKGLFNYSKDYMHYFFRNPEDLKVIGQLLGHQEIINNYEEINQIGKEATRVLVIIGHSISRVARGNPDLFNEMDLKISNLLRFGTVINMND